MPRKLHVLICEDQESDAFVINRSLEKGGFDVLSERVESAEELSLAMASKKFDLIISDFNIPGFGGADALALVRSINKDIPFILVSGAVGEATAVEMMRAGATDYLMKDNLAKLTEVVKRELEESKLREERYDAIEEIKVNEQKYRAVIDNSLFAILLAPSNGNILESNRAATELFGYSAEEFKQLSRKDLLDISDLNLQKKVLERDLYGHVKGEFVGIRKNGERFHCQIASTLIKDLQGNTLTSSMIQDISEQKLHEQMLNSGRLEALKNTALLQSIINSPKDVYIVALDKNLHFSAFTKGYDEHIKKTLNKEIKIGSDILTIVPEHLKETFLSTYHRALNGEHFMLDQAFKIDPNSSKISYYQNRFGPIIDDKGEIYGITIFVNDVTNLKATENRIANMGDLLNRAEGIAHIGSIEIDIENNQRIWSDEFFHIMGYQPGEIKPEKDLFTKLISEEYLETYQTWLTHSLENEGPTDPLELTITRRDGAIRNILLSGLTYANDQHIPIKHIGVAMDITEQKKIQLDLERQNNQLKDIAWAQSHLVRAPLSRLMGLVDVLQRGIVPKEDQHQYLTYLRNSAAELDNVIKDITLKTISK